MNPKTLVVLALCAVAISALPNSIVPEEDFHEAPAAELAELQDSVAVLTKKTEAIASALAKSSQAGHAAGSTEYLQTGGVTFSEASKTGDSSNCYKDSSDRDLPVEIANGSRRSKEECATDCNAQGYKYFGRQWAEQCWCGNDFGKHGSTSGCDCSGSNMGGWKNCVYEITSSPTPPPTPPTPPPTPPPSCCSSNCDAYSHQTCSSAEDWGKNLHKNKWGSCSALNRSVRSNTCITTTSQTSQSYYADTCCNAPSPTPAPTSKPDKQSCSDLSDKSKLCPYIPRVSTWKTFCVGGRKYCKKSCAQHYNECT